MIGIAAAMTLWDSCPGALHPGRRTRQGGRAPDGAGRTGADPNRAGGGQRGIRGVRPVDAAAPGLAAALRVLPARRRLGGRGRGPGRDGPRLPGDLAIPRGLVVQDVATAHRHPAGLQPSPGQRDPPCVRTTGRRLRASLGGGEPRGEPGGAAAGPRAAPLSVSRDPRDATRRGALQRGDRRGPRHRPVGRQDAAQAGPREVLRDLREEDG